MTTISAKTILRSRNTAAPGQVLSTILMRYPRWIHAEQRTHRLIPLEEGLEFYEPTPSLMSDPNLSRNAASSRAIPVKKLIADVRADPAIPMSWGKNQRGMQAGEEIDEKVLLPRASITGSLYEAKMSREEAWLWAMEQAMRAAEAFDAAGYHKQVVNRLIEPFSHITVLVSATEWKGFLELRDHDDAEPHIRLLAQEVRKCLERTDDVQDLQPGEWHLPFVTEKTDAGWVRGIYSADPAEDLSAARKLSTSRCASTSYKTVDGFDMTLEKAIELHDKLVVAKPIHASPAEHVAQADDQVGPDDIEPRPRWRHGWQHGNFVGFRQYRHQL